MPICCALLCCVWLCPFCLGVSRFCRVVLVRLLRTCTEKMSSWIRAHTYSYTTLLHWSGAFQIASFSNLHASCFVLRFHSALLCCACSAFIRRNRTLFDRREVWQGLPQCVKQTVKRAAVKKNQPSSFPGLFRALQKPLLGCNTSRPCRNLWWHIKVWPSSASQTRTGWHLYFCLFRSLSLLLLFIFSFLLSVIVRLCWESGLEILVLCLPLSGLPFKT